MRFLPPVDQVPLPKEEQPDPVYSPPGLAATVRPTILPTDHEPVTVAEYLSELARRGVRWFAE